MFGKNKQQAAIIEQSAALIKRQTIIIESLVYTLCIALMVIGYFILKRY